MTAILEKKFNPRWDIHEINEYIYHLIIKNKHLSFVEMLEPDITHFSIDKNFRYIIPNTSVKFAYQDMVDGYCIEFSAIPDIDFIIAQRKSFTLDHEFSQSTLFTDVSLVGELSMLSEKAYKDINRFRSDFLLTMGRFITKTNEHFNIKYNLTFDFNNNILGASVAFDFSYNMVEPLQLFYNYSISKDGILGGVAHKTEYENFLAGSTSKHMMLKFFLNNAGIENSLSERNHTHEEINQFMMLLEMKRI